MKTFQQLAAVLLLLVASSVHAFNFAPIESTFRPEGRGATQTFTIDNPGAGAIAVELTMFARDMRTDGSDVLIPAPDIFTIYPHQIILEPSQSQSIRVQYNGDGQLNQELAFRLVAEQLPIQLGDDETEGGAIDLMVKYMASVYVQPEDSSAVINLSLESMGEDLAIRMQNKGSRHAIINTDDFRVLRNGTAVSFTEHQREAITGKNILASRERLVRVPDSADLNAAALRIEWIRESD